MKQLTFSKVDPSVSPNNNEDVREKWALVVGKTIWLIGASTTLQFCSSLSTWSRFALHMPLRSTRRIQTANPGRDARAALQIIGMICSMRCLLIGCARIGGCSETGSEANDTNPTSVNTNAAYRSSTKKVSRYSIIGTSSGTLQRVGFFLESCSIKCGDGSQVSQSRQSVNFDVDQSFHEAFRGSVYFPSSLIELLPRCCPSVEEPSATIIAPTYLANLTIFISRNSGQFVKTHSNKFLTAVIAVLYPTALPMVKTEPSIAVHHLEGWRQSGHQRPKRRSSNSEIIGIGTSSLQEVWGSSVVGMKNHEAIESHGKQEATCSAALSDTSGHEKLSSGMRICRLAFPAN